MTSRRINVGETPATAAIFLSERLGFHDILDLTLFSKSLVRLDRGRPLLGSSSTLPFEVSFFRMRYTDVWWTFSRFEIDPTLSPLRARPTMASLLTFALEWKYFVQKNQFVALDAANFSLHVHIIVFFHEQLCAKYRMKHHCKAYGAPVVWVLDQLKRSPTRLVKHG